MRVGRIFFANLKSLPLGEIMIIGVVGNIASGKSTVVDLLQESFGWQGYQEEFAENPFLASFYTDPNRWSISSQLFFLAEKAKQGQIIFQEHARSGNTVIWDSPIQHNAWTFALAQYRLGNCTKDEWELYQKLFDLLEPTLPRLEVVYWANTPVEVLEQRIVSRGRSFEQGIPRDYLALLNELNQEWVQSLSVPVIEISPESIEIESPELRQKSAEYLQLSLQNFLTHSPAMTSTSLR